MTRGGGVTLPHVGEAHHVGISLLSVVACAQGALTVVCLFASKHTNAHTIHQPIHSFAGFIMSLFLIPTCHLPVSFTCVPISSPHLHSVSVVIANTQYERVKRANRLLVGPRGRGGDSRVPTSQACRRKETQERQTARLRASIIKKRG